jgi:hypothetical protein
MIIIFNLIGAGILMAAGAIGYLVAYLSGEKSGGLSILAGGLTAVVLDVLYRTKREDGSLFHPRRGGHISFIPAWIIGSVMIMVGGYGAIFGFDGHAFDLQSVQSAPPNSRQPAAKPRVEYQTVPVSAQQSYSRLKLTMISGSGQNGLASINGETFAAGETHTLMVANKEVAVTCVEIRDQSVMAKVAGESQPRELKVGESMPLAMTR